MNEAGLYRKLNSWGPGGWKCPCCAPPPGKGKKQSKRSARKKLKIFTDLIEKDLKNEQR